MNIKMFTYGSLAAVLLAGGAVTASAATIHFDQNGGEAAGNISYDGSTDNAPAIGSGIVFTTISGENTPNNNGQSGQLSCVNCTLKFTTGNNTQEGSGNGGVYKFANGGTFTLTGTAQDSGGTTQSTTNVLLDGTFTQTSIAVGSNGDTLNFISNGSDTKDPGLLNYFGYDPDTTFTFSNTEIALNQTTFQDDGSFDADVTNADLDNTPNAAAVPEPQELGILALGLALLGLGVAFRRKSGSRNG